MKSRLFVAAAALLATAAAIPAAHAQWLPAPVYVAPAPYAQPYYGYNYYAPGYAYYPSYYYSPSFPYNPTPGMYPESSAPRLMGSPKLP
jgi:opacity protein-like surface antigen